MKTKIVLYPRGGWKIEHGEGKGTLLLKKEKDPYGPDQSVEIEYADVREIGQALLDTIGEAERSAS